MMGNTKKHIGEFLGAGGIRLCMQSWLPESEYKAAIIIMHGGVNYCDMDMYNQLAYTLAEAGFAVYSFDQRGFGRSEGEMMHLASWDAIRGDFAAFIRKVRTLAPGKKIFAYGLSFGAIQTLDQAIVSPHLLSGIIINSFSTQKVTHISPVILKVIDVVAMVFPKMRVAAELDQSDSGNAWRDPLTPTTMTLATPKNLFKQQQKIAMQLHEIMIPVFHQQGLMDEITLPDRELAAKFEAVDYTYKEYAEMGHSLLAGVEADWVMNDICKWLEERL